MEILIRKQNDKRIHIQQLKKQVSLIKKSIDRIVQKSADAKPQPAQSKITLHYKVVNTYLNRVFLIFLINRIELEKNKIKNDDLMANARKDIAAILSKWEEKVGREFDELYNDKRPIHKHSNNHEVFSHFQKIGCAIDLFDMHYKEDARWQASLLAIRNRFLICFCNALNFKTLIRENDPSFENYIENSEILEVLKTIFDEYVQAYWNQNVKTKEFNVFEMNKALALIQFFKNFASVIEDRKMHDNYKKKYSVWKKYIQERNEENTRKSEEKFKNIELDKKVKKQKTRKRFFF